MWNGCWMLFSVFAGGLGLFSLYGMGVLAVLLMEGYPLVGVLIGCVGLVFCMFSAAGLGLTLLWRRKTEAVIAVGEREREERQRQSEGRRRIHKPRHVSEMSEKMENTERAGEYGEPWERGDHNA